MRSTSSGQTTDKVLDLIRKEKSAYWMRERERQMLALFHETAQRVPAYKDFLKKNKISPGKIRTLADFQLVPPVDKKNYLRQYPLERLVWNGVFRGRLTYTSTSGSTGAPFYFPRAAHLEWESSIIHEWFLRNGSRGEKGSVLIIDGFGMGVWIGGLLTYQAFEQAAARTGRDVSIITPGINTIEIFNALRSLAPRYDEVIIAGYPPFLKDIVDQASREGVDLKKLSIRLLFAAETFSEGFRDHVAKKAYIRNIYRDTANIYGTADIGTMAYETPTAIMARRLVLRKHQLVKELFGRTDKTPTLAQYNPSFTNFEAVGENVLITGRSALPLIRYAIGDNGGVASFDNVTELLHEHGFDLDRELRRAHAGAPWQLPFVYVYERNDFSTTLYGLQIYPEVVREALLDRRIAHFLSGKLTLMTKYDRHHDQYLEINIELGRGKESNQKLAEQVLEAIVSRLRIKNSEYRELHAYLKERALPKLVFWPHGHERHFKRGGKQKWVKQNA